MCPLLSRWLVLLNKGRKAKQQRNLKESMCENGPEEKDKVGKVKKTVNC